MIKEKTSIKILIIAIILIVVLIGLGRLKTIRFGATNPQSPNNLSGLYIATQGDWVAIEKEGSIPFIPDDKLVLYCHKTGKTYVVKNFAHGTYDVNIIGNSIYYKKISFSGDGNPALLYRYDLKRHREQKVVSEPIDQYIATETDIFYIKDEKVFVKALEDTQERELVSGKVNYIAVINEDLYYCDEKETTLYKTDKGGSQKPQKITDFEKSMEIDGISHLMKLSEHEFVLTDYYMSTIMLFNSEEQTYKVLYETKDDSTANFEYRKGHIYVVDYERGAFRIDLESQGKPKKIIGVNDNKDLPKDHGNVRYSVDVLYAFCEDYIVELAEYWEDIEEDGSGSGKVIKKDMLFYDYEGNSVETTD